jgi:hypothetical protein
LEDRVSYDVSHRDRYGFLRGTFEQGRLEFPIEVLSEIKPFLFPCQKCEVITFHVAVRQHGGLAFRIPFTDVPVASTDRSFHAICNDCATPNSELTSKMVNRLRVEVWPAQFCNLFMETCRPDLPKPYSESFIAAWLDRIPNERADLKKYVGSVLRCYALESDPISLQQSFCWSCAKKITPRRRKDPFLSWVFNDPEEGATFVCPKCGREVIGPPVS